MQNAANASPGLKRDPSHRIAIEPFDGTVTVTLDGATIASSKGALVLREASYPAVYYLPFEDVRFDRLSPSGTSTYCPFKGDASYWDAGPAGGKAVRDVMWAYQQPYDEVMDIKGYGAFYPNKVAIEAIPSRA